jgi:hypothetical protein
MTKARPEQAWEVLTAVTTFWVVTPYSPAEVSYIMLARLTLPP